MVSERSLLAIKVRLCEPPVSANISRRGAAFPTIEGGKTPGVVGESCKSRWIVLREEIDRIKRRLELHDS